MPRLDTLFLTLPVSWRGTVAQYVGRFHRLHEAKREVRVYDYADLDVPDAGTDVRSALPWIRSRRLHHRPARRRAVPGWPVDVPLPVDPAWKHDYAAQRTQAVRDGVQSSLAPQETRKYELSNGEFS